MTGVIIPEALWRRLRAFCDTGGTGQVILNVAEGSIVGGEIREIVRCAKNSTLAAEDGAIVPDEAAL